MRCRTRGTDLVDAMAETPRTDPSSPADTRSRRLPERARRAPAAVRQFGAAVHTGRDSAALSDLTSLLVRLLEAQRVQDDVLATVAHELRHPLHLMRMALGARFPDAGDPTREALERYTSRMTRLLDDLVDFIRLGRNDLDLEREWVDIAALLREVAGDFQPLFDQRRVALRVHAGNEPCWADADAQRLVQALSNVIDNALKFTPAAGTVTISVRRAAAMIDVRVRDTGRGLAPDRLQHVLHSRMDLGRSRGLGLGLAVAQRVLDLHGGALAIRSDGPGRGTEVVLSLPALNDAAATPLPHGVT